MIPAADASSSAPAVTVRRARRDDLPFVAWCNLEASSPAPGFCYWDPLLEGTGTPTRAFIEAVFQADAFAWGALEAFFIVEERGVPVAGGSGFTMNSRDYRPLHLGRLPVVAQTLGWSEATRAAFQTRYEQVWPDPLEPTLAPHAPWIIECVAVTPEARGRSLTRPLLSALVAEGARLGHTTVGISVTTGNVAAARAYESFGFQLYLAYGPDYFGGAFPGTTKYRFHTATRHPDTRGGHP
jgi:ribosomal protein S18 acetylase RimI-like enzyme